jgi:protein phosphatase
MADGMGGHAGGEQAASMVVEAILKEPGSCTSEGLHALSNALFQKGRQTPALYNMGTTLDVVKVVGDVACWWHVGDSRIWHFEQKTGILTDITIDHTGIGRKYRQHAITRDQYDRQETMNPYWDKALYAYMGAPPAEFYLEAGSFQMAPGDWIVLTTDGIHHPPTSRAWMQSLLKAASTPYICGQLTRKLIKYAKKEGSTDNATVLLYQHPF